MKKQAILSAVMALGICFSLAGCGDSGSTPAATTAAQATTKAAATSADKDIEKKLEKAANELEKAESAKTTKAATTAKAEITYEAKDEIKNATFASGLIQIGNDIFHNGGYYTIDSFLKEFGEKYDTAEINPAGYLKTNERKSYDIISKEDPSLSVIVSVYSGPSSDADKVKVADAIVLTCESIKKNAVWYPKGVTTEGGTVDGKSFTCDNVGAFLEENGFKQATQEQMDFDFCRCYGSYWDDPGSSMRVSQVTCREKATEANVFGLHPMYEYEFQYRMEDTKVWKVSCKTNGTGFAKFGDIDEYYNKRFE